MTQKEEWHWYHAIHEEGSYSGKCPSREDAISEGMNDWGDEHGFWIAEATNPSVKLFDYIDVHRIVEDAEEAVFEDDRASAEWDDIVFKVTPDQKADLAARIKAACDEWEAANGLTFTVNTFKDMRNVEYIEAQGDTEVSET